MQELEKILEKMKEIKDGNRKEKLYAKYPPNSKNQGILNAYSQGYEDGTDNFYNATVEIIRKHMNDGKCGNCSRRKFYQKGYEDGNKNNDEWIPVDERLPEGKALACDKYGEIMIGYICGNANGGYDCEGDGYEIFNVLAWRTLPEPYQAERSDNNDGE